MPSSQYSADNLAKCWLELPCRRLARQPSIHMYEKKVAEQTHVVVVTTAKGRREAKGETECRIREEKSGVQTKLLLEDTKDQQPQRAGK